MVLSLGFRFDLLQYELDLGEKTVFFNTLADLEDFLYRKGLVSDYVFWALNQLYLLRAKLKGREEKA